MIYISDKYFVKVLPYGALMGPGRDWLTCGFFGQSSSDASSSTFRNPSNLKGIIYAKIDNSRYTSDYQQDSGFLAHIFCDCTNLEYVNTRGWVMKYDEHLYISYYGKICELANAFAECHKLKSFDFSFIDTTPGMFCKNSNSVANTLGFFYAQNSTEYARFIADS